MRTSLVLFVVFIAASLYHTVYRVSPVNSEQLRFVRNAEDPYGRQDPRYVDALRILESSDEYDGQAHDALMILSDLANNQGHAPAQMWAGNLCQDKAQNPKSTWDEKKMWYKRALSYWHAAAQSRYPEAVSKLRSLRKDPPSSSRDSAADSASKAGAQRGDDKIPQSPSPFGKGGAVKLV